MNAHSVLEPTMKDILEVIKPLREDWAVRSKIIEELKDVIASIESFRGATVEPFGSFVSNLFTRWGDLDISIVLTNGSYISSAAKKRKQNLLREFLKALRQKGVWRRLQFVPNARIPILKFESGRQKISCDVSIDNLQGQMKSNFLFWINQIDGRFRDMVLLVKEWAKAHDINNPKTGTVNSYSLSLLVIFHFQTCVPPILPPLKEIYPTNAVDDLTGVRIVAEERIKETCNANIFRYMSDKYRVVNKSSLSDLFISFLAKFSTIHLQAAELGICTFTGQWQDIKTTMRWLPKTYALFIEDPFEQPENTARAVSAGNLVKISEAFQNTHQRLVSPYQNRASLLGTLIRPEISKLIPRTPARNSTYLPLHYQTPPHYQTAPRISYSMHSQPHLQPQIHNMREDKHPNFFTNERQGSHLHNGNFQRPIHNARLDMHPNHLAYTGFDAYHENTSLGRHPNYFANDRPESHINNFAKRRQETHLGNFNKRRQDGNPNNFTRQIPAQQYHGQGQHIWRPKSDSQGHFM